MEARIIKAKALREHSTREHCLIAENWSSEKISVARAKIRTGTTTEAHSLKGVDELYLIVRGKSKVMIGKLEPTEVTVDDAVFIPAGTRQQISNIGKSDLIFYCICTPRFTQDCYTVESTKVKDNPELT